MTDLTRSESCVIPEDSVVADENVVLEQDVAPAAEGAAPAGEGAAPAGEGAAPAGEQPSPQEMLVNMEINNQNDALNCIIGYIGLAQRRGVFALDESSKLFECIKLFRQQ